MIMDIMRSSSVQRLVGILDSRYGMGLELSFLNDSSTLEPGTGAPSLREGVLEIPIESNGKFLAVAKVPSADQLPKSSHDAITEIVRLILEPALYNWVLRQEEESGPTPQMGFGPLRLVRPELPGDPAELSEESSPVALVVSKNPHRIPRVALQIHEAWDRWAFLNWRDIREQIQSVQDIRDLGAMTLLVEDIFELKAEEKELLGEWALQSRADTEPALVLGSTLDWDTLRRESILPESLLWSSSQRQIHADHLPVDRRMSEDAIKLLLDKEGTIGNH